MRVFFPNVRNFPKLQIGGGAEFCQNAAFVRYGSSSGTAESSLRREAQLLAYGVGRFLLDGSEDILKDGVDFLVFEGAISCAKGEREGEAFLILR